MDNARDILKSLLRDSTVREKKPVKLEEIRETPPHKTYTQNEPVTGRLATSVPNIREVEYDEEGHEIEHPPAPVTADPRAKLDPDCEHKWQWKNGVKSCWLCGGMAPQDRRDSSTRWRG